MTWDEFKFFVDNKLEGKNPEIDYIETVDFPEFETIKVEVYRNKMIIE